jgi:hypothetical protein
VRADHVHWHGYGRVQTPALDGLAQDGIRFARGYGFCRAAITSSSDLGGIASPNPMHRDLNRGNQRLLWNALLNWQASLRVSPSSLKTRRPHPAPEPEE